VGGQAHFDQDHFEPNAANGGTKKNDYYNLYWCCKECNGAPNKGSTWPSKEEQLQGSVFSDSCKYDPEVVDFRRDGACLWISLTSAGRYSSAVLRLNERTSLRENCEARKRFHKHYTTSIRMLEWAIDKLDRSLRTRPDEKLERWASHLRATVTAYKEFSSRTPFVYGEPPPAPDPLVLESVLDLLG